MISTSQRCIGFDTINASDTRHTTRERAAMKYQIYQVKQDHLREVAFWPLESLDTLGIKLDMEKYARVYEGEIAVAEPLEVLEKLFETFNLEHPSDFQGRSMSVSDIVVLDGVSWYCDSFGWKEVAV